MNGAHVPGSTALPGFLIAGGQKCGTSWLSSSLAAHPQIWMPPAVKELFFFDRYFDRGLDWYARYFRDCPPRLIAGEATPSYLVSREAPERIAGTLPNVKLVFVLRDPIERARSAYVHHWRKGDTRASFENAIESMPALRSDGLYYCHLRRYFEHFDQKAIQVMLFEHLVADPGSFLDEVFEFLSVERGFRPAGDEERQYARASPRSFWAARALSRLSRALHRRRLHGIVALGKQIGVQKILFRPEVDAARIALSVPAHRRLIDYYREDVRALGYLLGRDFESHWLHELQRPRQR